MALIIFGYLLQSFVNVGALVTAGLPLFNKDIILATNVASTGTPDTTADIKSTVQEPNERRYQVEFMVLLYKWGYQSVTTGALLPRLMLEERNAACNFIVITTAGNVLRYLLEIVACEPDRLEEHQTWIF